MHFVGVCSPTPMLTSHPQWEGVGRGPSVAPRMGLEPL